jgi:hypothetical protein
VPSKLAAIHDAPSGCELELADSSRIALNVTHATIRDYVIADGFRDLQSFVDAHRIDVFHRPLSVSVEHWAELSQIVRDSDALATLPNIRSLLSLNHSELSALPNRLYGGIGCAVDDLPPVFYTSPTADFLPDDNRGAHCFFYSFASPGYDIHKLFVNLSTAHVEIESGNVPNHFLEDRRVT